MIVQKNADAFFESIVGDEVILLNVRSGRFDGLRDTGLAIWRQIDGVRDVDSIVVILQELYDTDPARIAIEVDGFLQDMLAIKYILVV